MLVSIPWQLPEGVPVSPQGKVYLAPAPFSTLGRRRQGLSLGSWSVAKAHNNEIILSLILGPLFVKKKKRGRERSRKNAFVDILLCYIFYFLYPLQLYIFYCFNISVSQVCFITGYNTSNSKKVTRKCGVQLLLYVCVCVGVCVCVCVCWVMVKSERTLMLVWSGGVHSEKFFGVWCFQCLAWSFNFMEWVCTHFGQLSFFVIRPVFLMPSTILSSCTS